MYSIKNYPSAEHEAQIAEIKSMTEQTKADTEAALKEGEERLALEAFWGHIEVMGRIIRFLYRLTPFDINRADFYDLFYLLQKPGKYSIKRNRKKLHIEVIEEDGTPAIGYNGKWYRSYEEFCQKAEVDGKKFTKIYDELYFVEEVQ